MSRIWRSRFAQKALAILVGAGDNPLPCGLDAGDEWRGRGIGKARQRRCCFMGKTLRGKFRMPDGDLLEILHAPEIAVHADGAQIEASNTQRLAADSV